MGSWWARVTRPTDSDESEYNMSAAKRELKKAILDAFAEQRLLQHLQDIDGWKAFHEFLESEYCGENTRFWMDVEDLHSVPEEELDISVLKIYERYFVKDATDQVNLPNHMVRSITVNVEKRNLNRTLYDAAQKRILSLMEGSQWARYPTSAFFQLWVEAKLSNPDSLFEIKEPKPERQGEDNMGKLQSPVASLAVSPRPNAAPTSESQKLSETEVKERFRSILKSKALQTFLADPLGYQSFENYLETSKIGFEFAEYLSFWLEVEGYKDHPSSTVANNIYTKYFVDSDSSGLGLIALPEMLLVQIRDEVNAASSTKELFTSAQVHIFNKLKKEAFTRKYFISDPFAAYLDKLALAEYQLLIDIQENDSKQLQSQFDTVRIASHLNSLPAQGKPSAKGLDLTGFQSVLIVALEKNWSARFKQKNRFMKWSTAIFKRYGVTNAGFLSFPEFVELCQEVLRDPKIPYCQIEKIK